MLPHADGAASPPPAKRLGGVGGGGQGVLERLRYHTHHAVEILHYVVVPESQRAISAGSKKVVTFSVLARLRFLSMLPAIKLDRDPLRMARKVDKVRTDRCLAAKVRPWRSKFAQSPPQPLLRHSHIAPQPPCTGNAIVFPTHRCHSMHPPPPTPPHRSLRSRREGSGEVVFRASYDCRRTSASCRCACRRRTTPPRSSPP